MKTEFMGYKRPTGTVGVRNHVAVIPSVFCAASTAAKIASQVKGAVAIMNNAGCGQTNRDLAQTFRTLSGTGSNPNVAATLVVSLGCEQLPPLALTEEIAKSSKPVEFLSIQETGGTIKTIERGVAIVRKMAKEALRFTRDRFGLSFLTLGTQCGGSDATSGLAANPALGLASDMLVQYGGTSILAETPELIGAEHWLIKRATNQNVADRIDSMVRQCERALKEAGEDFLGKQPSPGNIEGGLSSIEEKSLGCVAKGGRSPIRGVLKYGEIPKGKGLYIMDTSGDDVGSPTALVAGGCQIICFTTGRGTPVGNPIAPVIKITGNPHTCQRMIDNIDVNAGTVIEGKRSIQDIGESLFEEILAVASGKLTKAEILEFGEFHIDRLGPNY